MLRDGSLDGKGDAELNITSRLFLLYEMSHSGNRHTLSIVDRNPSRHYGMTSVDH